MHAREGPRRRAYEVFDRAMGGRLRDRIRIEEGLRRALAEDELRLHYQPIVDLEDRRIVAVEALIRWQHPEDGLLAPGRFLPAAEQQGRLIAQIGSCCARRRLSLPRPEGSSPLRSRAGLPARATRAARAGAARYSTSPVSCRYSLATSAASFLSRSTRASSSCMASSVSCFCSRSIVFARSGPAESAVSCLHQSVGL